MTNDSRYNDHHECNLPNFLFFICRSLCSFISFVRTLLNEIDHPFSSMNFITSAFAVKKQKEH